MAAASNKKKSQIHFTGIDRTGTKWVITEQQKAAVLASSRILGSPSQQRKQKKREA